MRSPDDDDDDDDDDDIRFRLEAEEEENAVVAYEHDVVAVVVDEDEDIAALIATTAFQSVPLFITHDRRALDARLYIREFMRVCVFWKVKNR